MTCKRGDIAIVWFPDSNLRTVKKRPVLIIQADNLNSGIAQIVVAMISTNLGRAGHGSRITVDVSTALGRQSGLQSNSVIMMDNLGPVRNSEIRRIIGSWSDMKSVDQSLRVTLGL